MLPWIRAHWRALMWPLVVLVSLVVGGLGGRYLAPPAVEVRTVSSVEWKDWSAYEHRAEEVKTVERTKVVYRTIDRPAGGGEHITEVETSGVHLTVDSLVHDSKAETHEGLSLHTVTSTPVLPQWRVALLVGASLREPLLPIAGPLVLGLEVDRHILGPLWLGAWVSTSGAAGLSVSGVF